MKTAENTAKTQLPAPALVCAAAMLFGSSNKAFIK